MTPHVMTPHESSATCYDVHCSKRCIEKCMFGDAYTSVSAISCWKNGAQLGVSGVSVSYAAPLVSAVGSAAGLERQFSTLGSTYGSLRAQLEGGNGWTAGISLQRTEQIISFFIFFLLPLYYNKIFCNKTKKHSAEIYFFNRRNI